MSSIDSMKLVPLNVHLVFLLPSQAVREFFHESRFKMDRK
jgi:hypothetical protein